MKIAHRRYAGSWTSFCTSFSEKGDTGVNGTLKGKGETMGLGTRIFLINDDDSIERLALARYERLLQRDPDESLPQYAGQQVRCAMVVLEFFNRKPVALVWTDYHLLVFDAKGRIDRTVEKKARRLISEAASLNIKGTRPANVVDARSRFAKKRYHHEYKWTPTPEIETAIMAAIFGTT
jgi:hypothetical protein